MMKIELTEDEMVSLIWLADRGYDCGLYEALEPDHKLFSRSTGWVVQEHKAREILEASKCPDSGFACLDWGSPLGVKIRAFLDGIA